MGPLRQRPASAQLASALLADRLGVAAGPEPLERLVERARVDAEAGGRLRADAAGRAQRMEELVAFADREGVGHAVVRQRAVQVSALDGLPVGAAPSRTQRLDDAGAAPAVPADEPLEGGAPLVEEEL